MSLISESITLAPKARVKKISNVTRLMSLLFVLATNLNISNDNKGGGGGGGLQPKKKTERYRKFQIWECFFSFFFWFFFSDFERVLVKWSLLVKIALIRHFQGFIGIKCVIGQFLASLDLIVDMIFG